MCGIFCHISESGNAKRMSKEWSTCKDLITRRGPDKLAEKFIDLTEHWFGHFAASVLWMQGLNLKEQPVIDSMGNILLWNGDIFSEFLDQEDKCDTDVLLNVLQSTVNVVSVFQEIQGPYSFVYFQKSTNRLYFGRDSIGRHSLLLKVNGNKTALTLTSVSTKEMNQVTEVPAIGIFCMSLNSSKVKLACNPWREPDLRFTDVIDTLETNLGVDIDIEETLFKLETLTCLHLHPTSKELEYLESNPYTDNSFEALAYMMKDKEFHERVDTLLKLLYKAVEVRVNKQPDYCKVCIKSVLKGESILCDHAKLGILFSGGLDSAILSLIADKYVPQNEAIDLINVAFEKSTNVPKKLDASIRQQTFDEIFNVPDRKTGRQTFTELSKLCPNRKWNFIEVNISQEELYKYRSSHISHLLYPLCSILDESLGCAVWFASRAKGIINTKLNIYESPCRVVLLGMGADELFGGYMRHRTLLKHKGWGALMQELNVELARISERNLGRDDRIVSDHGRQSRLPYLDENVVKYVQQLKPWERCYPTDKMPSGLGDKLLLRLVAYKLGFQNTANFPKRAFQFGSRIANGKENAKDASNRL